MSIAVVEIDLGNSRLKWRRLDGRARRVDGGVLDARPLPDLSPLLDGAAGVPVRVGSVAGPDGESALADALAALGAGEVRFARAAARCGRLVAGYREPERMGVDRWLALVAAARRTDGAFAVLDAGSALTLDLVDANGAHEGGWIVPGLRMMRAALLTGTAGVRFPEPDDASAPAPGRDTLEAVAHGTLLMARDFVARRLEDFRRRVGDAPLFVAGGDGARVAEDVAAPVESVPELVLDGLAPVLDASGAPARRAAR
jgi:type III pantothenate kinase